MFCDKCGHEINKNEHFCPECGNKITKNKHNKIHILNFIKDFILKHKRKITIGAVILIFFVIGILLFNNFYDFTKLSWNEENNNLAMYTKNTTITLNVKAYDRYKNDINEITFEVQDGNIESNGNSVKWKLPNKSGNYTITAVAPSGKKISKTIEVVDLETSDEIKNNLSGSYFSKVEDENDDTDGDGLTNGEEQKLGTDPNSVDTDNDGLSDYYEINVSKTDPLNSDTDGDGIKDGSELDLGLNPLKADSKDDGIKDSDRDFVYNINNKSGVSIEIKGKGDITNTVIDVYKNSTFSNTYGLLDKIYNFHTTGKLESATVKINYNLNELKEKNLSEDDLTLYYFNEETKELELIPTSVDKNSKQLTATLNHFSKYLIGDKKKVKTKNESKIMFVIDNSVSMYSTEQMIQAGYDSSKGAIGNDVDFKRLTLTNKLVDMFTGNYQFGVAEFSGNYVNLKKFNSDRSIIKQTISSMKSNWKSNASGTNIVSALKNGIKEFTTTGNNYLVLLTDGKNTNGSLKENKKTIISNAKKNNVKICVIGIGNDVDTNELDDISKSTGCNYYNATDSSLLGEIYSLIASNINYNYIDTDDDSKVDGMIQANSGFLVNRDGFSFRNFTSNKSSDGHCYGMALFAMLYYKDQLPLSLDSKDNSKFYLSQLKKVDLSSNGYNLNDTYFAKKNKLYDFKITDPGLMILLGDQPSDYRDRVENDTWMIKDEYYNEMSKIGVTFSIKDFQSTKFSKYQSASLNIDNDTFNKNTKKDDSQLLNAIWRLFILQTNAKTTKFAYDRDKAYDELVTSLTNGNPQILIINGNHAINAIKLIQDNDDSNKFKIEVYDNNYPGKPRYITMLRSKLSKVQLDYSAWINEYNYTFTYDSDDDGIEEKTTVVLSNPTVE